MEQVKKLKTICVMSSLDESDYIRQWTDQWTTNTTLKITPIPRFPHTVFYNINATHYQWCGPMLLIAEYLGKLTKSRIKINTFVQNIGLIFKSLFDGTTAVALNSMPSYHYVTYVIDRNMSSLVKPSPYIDFAELSKVLAVTRKGKFLFKINSSFLFFFCRK